MNKKNDIYIYIYIYIHTHTHTHTQNNSSIENYNKLHPTSIKESLTIHVDDSCYKHMGLLSLSHNSLKCYNEYREKA